MNMHITPDGTVAPSAARSSLPQPLALQRNPAGTPPLTRVSLAYVHQRFNLYLRFGQPERTLQLDHWRRCAIFNPSAIFCRVRWQANDPRHDAVAVDGAAGRHPRWTPYSACPACDREHACCCT